MKKLALTLVIVFTMTMGATAQQNAGMFARGYVSEETYYQEARDGSLLLPSSHGQTGDQGATPVGSGIAVLLGLGGAYLVAKKRKEE